MRSLKNIKMKFWSNVIERMVSTFLILEIRSVLPQSFFIFIIIWFLKLLFEDMWIWRRVWKSCETSIDHFMPFFFY